VNLGGLGWPIIQGIPLRKFDQVLGGAILVAVLALIVDLLLALAQHAAVPAGVRTAPRKKQSRAALKAAAAPA
jgi:osmoprotectant transport system permease protein